MYFPLLDVVEESWMQRHTRDIVILVIAALVAIAAITGWVIWKKRKNKNQQL
ncbi:MAG: LPXTG cell wall anchor domain-containing protein [Ferruginibacter sp.]